MGRADPLSSYATDGRDPAISAPSMVLSKFIRDALDEIVDEWAEFAQKRIPAAQDLSPEELRDHSKLLLEEIAKDMETPQSGDEQHQKSRGNRPGNAPEITDAARRDADQRFRQGFPLDAVVAEYRALRASVIRRWTDAFPVRGFDTDTVRQLTRFHEAMDQAIGESIAWYVDRVGESRNLMLGVLGHDLRNPLGAVRNSAEYLLRSGGLTGAQTKAAVRIQSSTDRMRGMVDDLLDFTRAQLGGGLPVEPRSVHLGQLARHVVDELDAFHPERELRVECTGDVRGLWDEQRLAQVISNLAANAIQHGDPQAPVVVSVSGEDECVILAVPNQGPGIAPEAQRQLFDPLMRPVVQEAERREGSSGLGLGLYIVREIALAHGGKVSVASSDRDGTTMTVRLPRQPPHRRARE